MAIDLFWDNEEQSVLLAEFNGKWTWDELHNVLSTIKRLSKEREQIFGAIIDLRNGMSMPDSNIFTREGLNQFKRLLALTNEAENKGPVVVLGMNGVIKAIVDAIATFDKSFIEDVIFAENEADARKQVYKAVAKLNRSVSG